MRSLKYFYLMAFGAALFVSSCSTSDKADTESALISNTSDDTKIEANSGSASVPSEESVYETSPIDSETELINASNGHVVRTSPDTLQINLENGEKVVFKDDNDIDHPDKYVYIGYDENLECYLVDLQFHEDFGVLAIDAMNGYQTRLPGPPIYNTKKNMFFCYGGRGSAPDSVIELYTVYGSGMGNIFRRKSEWTIENASWEDNTTISLTVPLVLPGGAIAKGEAKIQYWDGSWFLDRPQYYKRRWEAEDKSGSESYPVSISSEDDFYKSGYEYDLIKASNGRVMKPSRDILQINLENGEQLVFKDKIDLDHPDYHVYAGFDEKLGRYLIHLQFHENYHFLVIDPQDGKQIHLPGLPIYNPS
jgi:hypothetical protein